MTNMIHHQQKRAIALAVAAVIGLTAIDASAQQAPPPPNPAAGRAILNEGSNSQRSLQQLRRRVDMERLFENPGDAERAFSANRSTAGCIVRLSGDRAGLLLGGPTTNDPSYAKLNKAMSGRYQRCAPDGELGALSPRLLNFAIAETLVMRDDAAKVQDRAPKVDTDRAAAFHGALTGQITFDNVARCAAVYSPGLTRKVLATEFGSAGERTALKALYTQTPECAVRDVPAEVPSLLQRKALAESLYAWTHPVDAQ